MAEVYVESSTESSSIRPPQSIRPPWEITYSSFELDSLDSLTKLVSGEPVPVCYEE
jgi:hypothetical protein